MTKEFNLNDLSPVESAKRKIWECFDILRNNGLGIDESQVILLLLSLFKDDLISNDFLFNKEVNTLNDLTGQKLYRETRISQSYQVILPLFANSFIKLKKQGIKDVINKIFQIDKTVLTENFPKLFDSLLYRISQIQRKHEGEFILPLELSRFISGFFNLPKNARVLNPFAGLADFAVFLDDEQNYYGFENVEITWALGMLRLMAYKKLNTSQYFLKNSLVNWPDGSQKFDLVVSNPPYNALHWFRSDTPLEIKTLEQFLIYKGLNSLTECGKLIILIPQSFLYKRNYDQELRNQLVFNDLLDTVISLPGGLLQNTAMPMVILVINKGKKQPGKVRFITADKFIESKGSREKVLNDHALISLIHGKRDDKNVIRVVDIEQIREWDYNLNVQRYFHKPITKRKNEHLVKLKDILSYYSGRRQNLPETGKLLRIRNLNDDIVDFNLNVSEIEYVGLNRTGIHQLSETCLLLAVRWRTLKPTLFHYDDESIYRRNDILSFRVDESIADYAFIINELNADYVLDQLESFRLGGVIPFIRKDDLLEIVIKLPSLDEQKAKIQGIIELSNEIKSLQEERNTLAHGVSTKLYESVSTIKHFLGKPLLNIGSSLRNIEKTLSQINENWGHYKINERYNVTLKDTFDTIYHNLEFVHSFLKKNESELDLTNYKLDDLNFISFIKGYVKKIKSTIRANVNVILEIHPDTKLLFGDKISVTGNAELLEMALNNIVENAYMHAFIDPSQKYNLEFRVSFRNHGPEKTNYGKSRDRSHPHIKLDIANNGKPFPENYTLEKLIRKNSFAGETGNTGQGGYDLNEIIKFHNGGKSTLELINESAASEFVTIYSFLIPISR